MDALCTAVICKMIERHQHVRSAYQNIKARFGVTRKIIEPGNTRFKTSVIMAESILENRCVLRELVDTTIDKINTCAAKRETKKEFIETINNCQFWSDLNILLELLQPIAEKVTIAEADSYFIEHAYEDMLQIYEHVKKTDLKGLIEKERALEIVMKRWNFIYTSSMGFAYLLNPRTNGKHMLKCVSPVDGSTVDDYQFANSELKAFFMKFYDKSEIKQVIREYEEFCQEFAACDDRRVCEHKPQSVLVSTRSA